MACDEIKEPVAVIALVGQQNRSCERVVEEFARGRKIMRLSRRDRQLDRQAAAIDQSVDLRRQPAARAADRLTAPFFAPAEC